MLLQALLLGDVTIPASANFADKYQRVRQPQRPSQKSLVEQQYEVSKSMVWYITTIVS